jgi:hypothetical protein
MSFRVHTITMSGSSWDDAFHPGGTEFYNENPDMPQAGFVNRGRGRTAYFLHVPIETAYRALEQLEHYAWTYRQDVCQEDDPEMKRYNLRHRKALERDAQKLRAELDQILTHN